MFLLFFFCTLLLVCLCTRLRSPARPSRIRFFFCVKQVLLEKHASVLQVAEHTGRRKVVTALAVLRGAVGWILMGAGTAYALLAVVEEELAYHFGCTRVVLVGALVRLLPLVVFIIRRFFFSSRA